MLLDLTPRALLEMAGDQLPAGYARSLRAFRYGNAASKVDFALNAPSPGRIEATRGAGTVHLGGTRAQIARAENTVSAGRHADEPYVLVSQPTVVDASRAPAGKHVAWAYSHVPRGSTVDQRRRSPGRSSGSLLGFRDTIIASSSRTAMDLEEYNPNYILGDIASGAPTIPQLLKRPVLRPDPWRTPLRGVYLCSASTAPGPGVHGLPVVRRTFGASPRVRHRRTARSVDRC